VVRRDTLKNKKSIVAVLLLFFVLLSAGGTYVGDYFVDFALKRGNADDPLAIPAACQKILDPNVKPQADLDFRKEIWQEISFDGLKLTASHFTPKEKSDKWVVVVHGYGRSQNSVWDIANQYLKNGYHVLVPDLRASGESEGSYLSMGYFESDDVKLWIDQIVQSVPKAEIVLHGVSMGAATVIQASVKSLPDNVKAIVEDCGYTSAYTMFSLQLKKLYGLPAFPIMDFVNVLCKTKAGYYLSDANPLAVIDKNRIPMLFIHGGKDELAPFDMMLQLYEAANCEKEKLEIVEAGHADSRNVDPVAYYKKVFSFIDQYIYKNGG